MNAAFQQEKFAVPNFGHIKRHIGVERVAMDGKVLDVCN